MSGIKPLPLVEFYRALHARGETTTTLAASLGVSGGAVRRVLAGLRRRGPLYHRLERLLTPRERALLAHVEQCSAWNSRPAALHRPRWTPATAARLHAAA